MNRRNIYIYTSLYPFSLMAENFLGEELRIGAGLGLNITVIPIGKDKIKRELPKGVILDESLCNRSQWLKIKAACRLLKFSYLKEIMYNKKRPNIIKYRIDTLKYLYAASLVYNDITVRACGSETSVFYSYWFSYAPIAFADYKKQHPQTQHRFISRAHTFATFGTSCNVYYPLRDYVFKFTDSIFAISTVLINELHKRYPEYADKIELSRLGVTDNFNANRMVTQNIEIVSCSSVIPLKRVDLIFESINQFAKNHKKQIIRWTHVGDGPLMPLLYDKISKEHENNLIVDMKGALPNEEILKLYFTQKFDAFILLSIREGVPVVIMEALSSGIPVLATEVGGIPDIVTPSSGRLIEKDFPYDDFEEALDEILKTPGMVSTSHVFFMENYSSEKNYRKFYEYIIN